MYWQHPPRRLFEGGVYFTQRLQLCGVYSRAASIRGNTVVSTYVVGRPTSIQDRMAVGASQALAWPSVLHEYWQHMSFILDDRKEVIIHITSWVLTSWVQTIITDANMLGGSLFHSDLPHLKCESIFCRFYNSHYSSMAMT